MRLHRLMTSARALAIVTGLTLLVPIMARAEGEKTVEATGEAAITNDDVAQAKERATKAALRDAVERTLGTYVASDSQEKDFALVKDQILTASQGYVSSYDVIDEKKDPVSNAYVVKIRAKVAAAQIEKDAAARGLAIRAMKFPRMAILIAEQHLGQTEPSAWWGPNGAGKQPGQTVAIDQRLVENELIGEWTDAGFTFVDMDALAGKLKAARVVTTNPGADEVRQIANLSDADVIIVGTAVATQQGDLGALLGDKSGSVSMVSCKGSISARVFNADSGEILATSEASKTALNVSPMVCDHNALLATTKIFAADMQKKVLEAWNKRLMGGSRIRMSVKGITSFHVLSEFKSLLKETVRGVQAVDQKSYKDGAADLDLRVDGGDTEALANDLDSKSIGKYKVRVVSMTANTIEIEIAK